MKDSEGVLIQCLRAMLRPIISFCMRRSLTVQDLLEQTKITYLEVAAEELRRSGQKVNVSRLSVVTGLHRRDVMRIYRDGQTKGRGYGLAARVIGQWLQDPRFQTKSHRPRVLSIEGEDSEFRELVRSISSDVHPGTVLFDLERVGAVEHSRDGVKLLLNTYVPRFDPQSGFEMLGADAEDLMYCIEENIEGGDKAPHFHAKTMYDNVDQEAVPEIRSWLHKQGAALHHKARKFIAKHDLDVNPKAGRKGGARVVLGTFTRS